MQTLPPNLRKKFGTLLLVGVAIGASLLLASGFSGLELHAGRSIPFASLLQLLGAAGTRFSSGASLPVDILRLMVGCLWVLLFISVIAFIASPQVRKEVFRRVIVYTLWFLLFFALFRLLQPHLAQLEFDTQPAAESGQSEIPNPAEIIPPPPTFIVDPPAWVVAVVSILLIAVPLSIAWLVWYLFAPQQTDAGDSPLEQLTQEAQHALDGLQSGADLKDTILRCYYEMSQILSKRRNLHRSSGMTPREFEQYLAESGLHSQHINRLTRLFERVRYGNKPTGRQEEQEAVNCLTAIVQSYGQPS